LRVPLGLDAYVPAPASNPLRRETAELGRLLFFSKELSRDRTLSCAGCHLPERAFTDGKPLAEGVRGQRASRRTPPILNRAWGRSFFWDGRAATLEDQVVQPITNPVEMDLPLPEAVERASAVAGRKLTRTELAAALAAYVRTILAGGSPYDRFVAGDRSALTAQEQLGLRLFRGKANCAACHVGPNLTDERFHNTGTGWREGRFLDAGRETVTGDEADRGAFKTPSLREVARAAPYMHDGSLATLEEVIDFYDKGGRDNPFLDAEIRELNLNAEEKAALAAFLRALSGKVVEGWPR
jgi:cytochrome c peroxidase